MTYSDELCHYGVQGMKWGTRRYQNEDGTLTEEGRRHYGRTMAKELNKNDRRIASAKAQERKHSLDAKKYRKKYKKAVSDENQGKAKKLKKKIREADSEKRKEMRRIQRIEEDNKDIVESLIEENYDVDISSIPRISITNGEIATYAVIAAADTLFPFTAGLGYAYLAARHPITKGHKYKVSDNKDKERR